jgi:hypothetical protein
VPQERVVVSHVVGDQMTVLLQRFDDDFGIYTVD